MYKFVKNILFSLDPECSHYFSLESLKLAHQLGMLPAKHLRSTSSANSTLMGLQFPNLIGLAAGLDKNADYVDALAALGFGFIEIGTVTPKPQIGNPRPRLFRLIEQEAIINRMGFNNKGVDYVAQRLEKIRYRGILGVNIGKNKETPLESAVDDYLIGFRNLWKFASYITVNISSPNTQDLRKLQQGDLLKDLLSALKREQQVILQREQKYVPLVVKISPDISEQELYEMAEIFLANKMDGVIATNTTTSRDGVETSKYSHEMGGLSGKPLSTCSTQIIKKLHAVLGDKIPIIASGGIMDENSAREKIKAGASLLQLYTGFIYAGPNLINRLVSL